MAKQQNRESTLTRQRYARPGLYDVIVHNDDFTTMDFVVIMLRQVFFLPETTAIELMMTVHHTGSAKAGTYTYDIAESKAMQAKGMARKEGFPLKVTIEPHQ